MQKNVEIIDVIGPDANLGKLLIEGKLISYHDDQYQVTSGNHEILMKLLQQEDGLLVLFYLHVPYAYPLPNGIKTMVKSALEIILGKPIQKIEFVNAGTEAHKKDILFKISGGEF
jgi:hypothetical protein